MKTTLQKIPALICILTVSILLSACGQTAATDSSQFAGMDYTYYLTGGNPPPYTRSIFSTTNF